MSIENGSPTQDTTAGARAADPHSACANVGDAGTNMGRAARAPGSHAGGPRSVWPGRLLNVLRGALIGLVEIVPGVSGGTVALIVGVYETLIRSAGHVLSAVRLAVVDVPRGQGIGRVRAEFRRADWATVIPVLVGMGLALVVFARLVEGFVHGHQELSRGLFFGLVLASVAVPISMVGSRWRPTYVAAAVVAALAAFLLTGLPPTDVTPSPLIIVASAAVAVSALILPGLSGSFLLLTFGLYAPTIGAVNDRDLGYLALFALGMVLGLASFVKALQWLLEHRRELTLAILTGVILGCLRALWPWQSPDRTMHAPGENVASVGLVFLLGLALVLGVLFAVRRIAPASAPGGGGSPQRGARGPADQA